MRRGIALLALNLAAVALMVGCGTGSGSIEPRGLVPEGADFVARVDVERAVQDEHLVELWDWLAGQPDMQEGIEHITMFVGEEPKEMLVFGDAQMEPALSFEERLYLAYAVRGEFDEEDLIAEWEAEGQEFEIGRYKGKRLYADEEDHFGIASMSGDTYLLGDLVAVRDSIDVAKTGEGRVDAVLTNALQVYDQALLTMVVSISTEQRDELRQDLTATLEGMPMAIGMRGLTAWAEQELQVITIDKDGEAVYLMMAFDFTGAEAAEEAGGLLETLLTFLEFLPEGEGVPTELMKILESIEVEIAGSLVEVNIDMTVSEIQSLIDALNLSGSGAQVEQKAGPGSGYWPG